MRIPFYTLFLRFPSIYGEHFDISATPLRQEDYSPIVAYNQSKLCNILFAFELNRRLSPYGVYCNAVNPGCLIWTKLQRNSIWYKIMYALFRPFTKSKVIEFFIPRNIIRSATRLIKSTNEFF